MDAVLDERYIDVQKMPREKYEDITHAEVAEGIHELIEKHREALTALANA